MLWKSGGGSFGLNDLNHESTSTSMLKLNWEELQRILKGRPAMVVRLQKIDFHCFYNFNQ